MAGHMLDLASCWCNRNDLKKPANFMMMVQQPQVETDDKP